MWRIFKRYDVPSAGYDGIAERSLASADLDECTVAASIRLEALLEIIERRKLKFGYALKAMRDLDCFKELMVTAEIPCDKQCSAAKWKRHLRQLENFGILKSVARSTIKCFAKYFAVLKSDGITARAIFNGREMSKYFKTPPTTNLADIPDLLRELSQCSFFAVGDFRHYFHQYGLANAVSEYFGLESGALTYMYLVLPMGWSWSPRLAQSGSTAMLIEAACRGKLADPKDFADLENPPSMVRMRNGGFAVVWYDNVMAAFKNADDRDIFFEKMTEVCKELHVQWKDWQKFSRKDMAETKDPKQLPCFLGLTFVDAFGKRPREESGQSAKTKWHHHPDRVKRWSDLTETSGFTSWRSVARAVGIVLWDATISLRSLCFEERTLSIMSRAGRAVVKNRWDDVISDVINSEEIEYLRSRIHAIVNSNIFRTFQAAPSTATVLCASDACDFGYGYVTWEDDIIQASLSELTQQAFPAKLCDHHIFLKEMWAALQCIERITETRTKSHIVIAEDNTAVAWALRNRFSHNKHANEMIQRVEKALDAAECTLQVVSVPSALNAADAPSRGWKYDNKIDIDCRAAINQAMRGIGKVAASADLKPPMTGRLRHEEPPELWNGWNIDMTETEAGDGPVALEPAKGLEASGR